MTNGPFESDLALWARAAAGEASAVEAVMKLAAEIVRTRARGFSADDVDELTSRLQQCVMTRLHNKEAKVVRSSLRGWLSAWLCSVRKDLLRHRRRHRCETLSEQTAGRGPTPSHAAELKELQAAVDKCLGKMPEKHRDAILARHGQVLSASTPAPTVRNRNPTTLRVWVMRGLLSLRECMKRRGFAHV